MSNLWHNLLLDTAFLWLVNATLLINVKYKNSHLQDPAEGCAGILWKKDSDDGFQILCIILTDLVLDMVIL